MCPLAGLLGCSPPSFTADPRSAVFATMRQLAAAALAFAYAGGAMAFSPAPSSLAATRSPSLRSAGVSLAPQARPTVSLGRKGRAALRMVETMEGRHLPQIIQGGMGVQVRLQKKSLPLQSLHGWVLAAACATAPLASCGPCLEWIIDKACRWWCPGVVLEACA